MQQYRAMDILKGMKTYLTVVDSGSLIAAADLLDTSNAAISRQLAALEEHLGTRLLNRTTRRLSMTDAGQEFYARAQQIMAEVGEAEAIAGASSVRPTGLLRVSVPVSFGISTLSQWLPGFMARYPDLKIDIDLSDRLSDLVTDGIDVAVRIARQPASTNLVSRKLAAISSEICAAPSYIARHGEPQSPEELAAHRTLNFSYLATGDSWTLANADGRAQAVRIKPFMHANNGDILCRLAVQGEGIILQPNFIVAADMAAGRLVRILKPWSLPDLNLYAVYLNRQYLPAKVRVFIDYLSKAAGSAAT